MSKEALFNANVRTYIVMLNSYIEIWYGGLQKARDPALTPVLVIIIHIMLSIL